MMLIDDCLIAYNLMQIEFKLTVMTTEELQVLTIRNAQSIISWARDAVAQDRWLEFQRNVASTLVEIVITESDADSIKAKLRSLLGSMEGDLYSFASQSIDLRTKAQVILGEAVELATAVELASDRTLEKMMLLEKKVAELEEMIEIIINDSRADRLRITALENRAQNKN
jgi:hypothetical protein